MAAKQKQEKQTSWLVLIAIGMGILMAMLDITIVNVALPTIQHEFHTSYVSTQWIVNAYTATYAISILLISKLGDMYGKKLFFLLSMGIFTAGSLLCAIAPNSLFLNISRGIEGVGGAGILGLSMALIGDNYEGKQRAFILGIWGSIVGFRNIDRTACRWPARSIHQLAFDFLDQRSDRNHCHWNRHQVHYRKTP